jgi:hypothetical protein
MLSAATLTTWTAVLESKGGSDIRGTATVESLGADSARATIQLTGAKAGTAYNWAIHSGSCGSKGQLFGKESQYTAITADQSGRVTGTATIAAPAPSKGDYSVTVFKSKARNTPVSCGTLKPSNGNGMQMDSTGAMTTDSTSTMNNDSTKSHWGNDSTARTDSIRPAMRDSIKPMQSDSMKKDSLPKP